MTFYEWKKKASLTFRWNIFFLYGIKNWRCQLNGRIRYDTEWQDGHIYTQAAMVIFTCARLFFSTKSLTVDLCQKTAFVYFDTLIIYRIVYWKAFHVSKNISRVCTVFHIISHIYNGNSFDLLEAFVTLTFW